MKKITKVTLNLRSGDPDRLRDLHPDVPYQTIVRQLVADYIEKKEAELEKSAEDVIVNI